MTTPVAPLRIRIQSHAPLPALKLWFSIPSASTSSSLDDLSLSIHQFLVVQGLDARIKIVLELQGFEFPPNALCSLLDLANDVLDVNAAVSTSTPLQALPAVAAPSASSTTLPVPPKATLLPAKRPASSSSSSSDSDSDSDSDDSGPETATTGPPPAPNPNRLPTQPPPSKRAKVASSSSSSSSSSSPDSSSDEEDEFPVVKKAEVKIPVAPGKGNKRTQARNARRRLLNKSNAASSFPVVLPASDLPPSPSPTTIAATVVVASSTPDPYGGFDGPKLDMMHMAIGNKNKKKHIHVAAAGKKERVAVRTTFFPEASTSSSLIPPATPVVQQIAVQTPTKSTRRSTLHLNPTDYALQCPSGKTNLPNNVVVTRVNVEAADWVPGLGEIVQGTSRDYVEPLKRVVAVPVVVEAAPVGVKLLQERTSWAAGAWPRASDLESIWDSLRVLPKEQGKEGDRVAVKILELGYDYTPTITFKYGSLILTPKDADDPSEPDACIRLHSDCYADTSEETYEEEQPYWMTPKPKFGQPIEGEEEDWESDPSMFFVEWDQVRWL